MKKNEVWLFETRITLRLIFTEEMQISDFLPFEVISRDEERVIRSFVSERKPFEKLSYLENS